MKPALWNRVQRWLKRDPLIRFPATKDDVVASLKRVGAPEDIVRMVRALPVDSFERREHVGVALDPGTRRSRIRGRFPGTSRKRRLAAP